MSYKPDQEVEIYKKEEGFLGYYPATVLRAMPTTVALAATEPTEYLVRYKARQNEEQTGHLEEVVRHMDIRPKPTQNPHTDYEVNDRVDAFICGCWCEGSVRRKIDPNNYNVELECTGNETRCAFKDIRLHLDWEENKDQVDNNSKFTDSGKFPTSDVDSAATEPEAKKMKIASKLNENQRTNFIGVIKRQPERYVAKIQHEGVSKWIGTYDTAKEAAEAYDKVAIELRGAHKARTNFPISDYVQSQIKETEENKVDEQVQGIERVNQKGAVSRTQVETVSRDQANTNICGDVSNVRIKLKESGSSTLPVCNSFDSKQERGAGAGPEAQSMKIPGESDSKMNDKNMRGTRKLPSGNWMASMYHEGVHNWLGAYDTKEKAAKAYDKAAIELRGEHKARTNFSISDYVQTQIKKTEENKVDEQMQGIERVNQKGAVSRTQVEAVSRDQANTNTRGDVSNVPIKLKESGSTVSVCNSFDSKQEHGEGADPEAQSMKIPGESDSKMNDRKTRGIRKLQSGNWMAKIYDEGVYKWLGAYDTAEKAARAYDKAAIELLGRGQKVQTNFPISDYVEIQIKETEENKADERSSESKENVEEKREP